MEASGRVWDTVALWGYMLNRGGRSKHYDQGIQWFDEGRYEQAIEAFKAALAEPKGAALTARLARFYLAESYSALARTQMTGAESSDESAIQNLKAALVISPGYADLHFNLGTAFQQQKQYTDALAAFDQAIQINPGYARARVQRAITLHALARPDEALRAVEDIGASAAGIVPNFLEILAQAGRAHAAGDLDALGDLLRRMGRDDPDDAHHHADRALDYFRQGLLNEAIDEWRQAVRLAPHYADMRNQLGVALYAVRRDEDAVKEFTKALDINPRYIEARLNRGLTLLRLERRDESRRDFVTVLEQERDNQAAREHLNAVDSGASPQ